MGKAIKLPKTTCCVSKSRCDRCPIRMLKDGDLPTGYGVHKRVLVRVDSAGRPLTKKSAKAERPKVKVAKKITKSELASALKKSALKKQKKKSGKKKSLAA